MTIHSLRDLEQRWRYAAKSWEMSPDTPGARFNAACFETCADDIATVREALEQTLKRHNELVWAVALAHAEHAISEISAAGKLEQYAHGLADAAEAIRDLPVAADLDEAALGVKEPT